MLISFYLLILHQAKPSASFYQKDALRMARDILPAAEGVKLPPEYGRYGASNSLYGLMIWIFAMVTKNVAFSLYLPALAVFIAYLVINAAIGWNVKGAAMAFFSMMLPLCCPRIVLESRIGLYHQIFTLTIGSAMIWVSLQNNWTRWKKTLVLTILLAIAILSSAFNCVLFAPSVIIVLLMRPKDGKIQGGGKLAALLVLISLFLPKIKEAAQALTKNLPTGSEVLWSYFVNRVLKAVSSIDLGEGVEQLEKLFRDLFWRADSFFYKDAWLFDFFDQPLVPPVITLLFIIGLGRSIARRNQNDITLIAFFIPPALMLGFIVESYYARYTAAFMPVILIIAAREAHSLWNRFSAHKEIAAKTTLGASVAAMLIYSYLYCIPTFNQRNSLAFVESVAAYINNVKDPERMAIFLPFLPHNWTEAFQFITRFKYAGRVFPQAIDPEGWVESGRPFAQMHPDNRSLFFMEDRLPDKRFSSNMFNYYPPDPAFFKYIPSINAFERTRRHFPPLSNFNLPHTLGPNQTLTWDFTNQTKDRFQIWCHFKPADHQTFSIDAAIKNLTLTGQAKTICSVGSDQFCWKGFGSCEINPGRQSLLLKNSSAAGAANLNQCMFIAENRSLEWSKKIVDQSARVDLPIDKEGFYELVINNSSGCSNIARVDHELYPSFIETTFMRFLSAGNHDIDIESSCSLDQNFNITAVPLDVIGTLTPKNVISSESVEIRSGSTRVYFSPTKIIKSGNQTMFIAPYGKHGAESACFANYRLPIPAAGTYDLWVLAEYGKTAGEFYLSINGGPEIFMKPPNTTWGAESYARWVKMASVNFNPGDIAIKIGAPFNGKDLTLRDIMIVKSPHSLPIN
ncbi:MAG: hypothetical protein HY547_09280 [Elusimicrobia bacterium]|nr:hypothetical protein [Elusimicrobiota bacterium]